MLLATNSAFRQRRMTRDEFFSWAGAREGRFEFDGFQPVAMTGRTMSHSQATLNIHAALRARLRGTPCHPLGPDAGVATTGDAVRYPDALITCTKFAADDLLAPGVVVVFEVISQTSGRVDRIDKVREYRAVSSILRYVIVERTSIGLTVFKRVRADDAWTATTLTAGDILHIPEVGIEVPVDGLYEGVELAPGTDDAGPGTETRAPAG